jgi:hypothetical protein
MYSRVADGVVLMDLLGMMPSKTKIQIDNPVVLTEVLSLLSALAVSGMLALFLIVSLYLIC